MQKLILIASLLLWLAWTSSAQVASDSELFIELVKLDSLIFDEGFNNCNFSHTKELVSDEFEFYHDKMGIEDSKVNFISTLSQNICGNPLVKPVRKLVKQSLQVFPLYNRGKLYGAIQTGNHEFYISKPGEEQMQKTGIAKFTHLWIKEDMSWKLKRVLSYDHQDPVNK